MGQTGERSGPVTSWSAQQWETEAGSGTRKRGLCTQRLCWGEGAGRVREVSPHTRVGAEKGKLA